MENAVRQLVRRLLKTPAMTRSERFRAYAERALDAARRTRDPEGRAIYRSLAKAWLRLARRAAKREGGSDAGG